MALQWMILTYVVAAKPATSLLLTLPSPKLIKEYCLVSLIYRLFYNLRSSSIVPFAGFQLLGLFFCSLSLSDLLRIRILSCMHGFCSVDEKNWRIWLDEKNYHKIFLCISLSLFQWFTSTSKNKTRQDPLHLLQMEVWKAASYSRGFYWSDVEVHWFSWSP